MTTLNLYLLISTILSTYELQQTANPMMPPADEPITLLIFFFFSNIAL